METNVVSSESDSISSDDLSGRVVAVVKDSQTERQRAMRFRVVKLVNTEPYQRGRWLCRDFPNKENEVNSSSLSSAAVSVVSSSVSAVNSEVSSVNTTTTTTATQQQPTPQTTSNANMSQSNTEVANGVAIDNKIEQAMDLVKSHLMFAVREEVDVLKERIKELESEIQILRAHASNDTLQLLLQQQQRENQTNNE